MAAIQDAIRQVTEIKFEYYATPKTNAPKTPEAKKRPHVFPRSQNQYDARLIFVHHCDLNKIDFMRYFKGIDRTVIYHYRNAHASETKFNPKFREIAKQIEDILNKTNE